jgi:UDP:flavonoid glycosyltransferase YjiC (YdhE family)
VRLAVERALRRPGVRERVAAVARWSAEHDGAAEAARQVEDWAARRA